MDLSSDDSDLEEEDIFVGLPSPSGTSTAQKKDPQRKVNFGKPVMRVANSKPKLMRIPQRPTLEAPSIHAPTVKEMERNIKIITDCPEGTSIVIWLINTLNAIPHGDGTALSDKILANKICEKLRQRKDPTATEIATAICSELNNREFRWKTMMENVTRSFPQGKGYLSEQIKKAIQKYNWLSDSPLLLLAPVFRNAQISLDQTIDETPQGHTYLVMLRKKLPASLRQTTPMDENETWASFFSKLQDFGNQEIEDQSVDPSFQSTPFDKEVKQKPEPPKYTYPLRQQRGPAQQSQNLRKNPSRRYTLRNLPGRPRPPPQQHANQAVLPPTPPTSQNYNPGVSQHMGPVTRNATFESILGLNQEPYPCNCYACGRHGHKQFDCPIAAYLDLNNLRLKQTGEHVSTTHKNTTPEIRNRQERRWGACLRGANPLKKPFANLNDFNEILRSVNEPPVQQTFKQIGGIDRPSDNLRHRSREQQRTGTQWPPVTPSQANALNY